MCQSKSAWGLLTQKMADHGRHTIPFEFSLTIRLKINIFSGSLPPFSDPVTSYLFNTNWTISSTGSEHLWSLLNTCHSLLEHLPWTQRIEIQPILNGILPISVYKLENVCRPTRLCICQAQQSQNVSDLICVVSSMSKTCWTQSTFALSWSWIYSGICLALWGNPDLLLRCSQPSGSAGWKNNFSEKILEFDSKGKLFLACQKPHFAYARS